MLVLLRSEIICFTSEAINKTIVIMYRLMYIKNIGYIKIYVYIF